jgi:hypothetical protein
VDLYERGIVVDEPAEAAVIELLSEA